MAFTVPVTAGSRFGPYEVLSSLGAGGMGEVYRARDERLGRIVAIKVLASDSHGDPELRERLRREARALSRLSHPNVCAVYDVGTEGDRDYFVMELLEGETLAKRLERGPLPIERVLDIALQIAAALETSHRMGLVHRDLKPANIMVTTSGVKLLDFGLVRFAPSAAQSSRETISDALTRQGTLLGTVQYMSPEQVEGREADARSDLFSFGAVIYEMLTGRRAFGGDTQASLIGSILKDDAPSLLAVQPAVPSDLDRLIHSCLVKNPDDRWQSAHDLRVELGWIADKLRRPDAAFPVRRSPRAWMAVAVISAAVAAVMIGRELGRTPLERLAVRSMLPPPENSQYISVGTHAGPAVLSPDGRRVAFLATSDDATLRLSITSLDSLVTQSLHGTEGASYPFWSADGESLGFFAEQKLKTIAIASGSVTTLSEAAYGAGGTWNSDGTIVFAPGLQGGLHRVSAGGTSRPATALTADRGEATHRWPVFLPDGRRFLYTVGEAKSGRWKIKVGALDSDRADDVIEGASNALYANGALIFTRSGTLLAQPVDERSLRTSGSPVQLAENVRHDIVLGRAVFSASQTGSLIYQVGSAASGSQLLWLNRSGKELNVVEDTCFCIWPRLSPDEQRVAVAITDARTGGRDIWTYELAERSGSRLTFEEALEGNPEWTPDGSRIVFNSTRRGVRDLHWMNARGRGPQEPLLESDGNKFVSSVSPAGVIFAVTTRPAGQTGEPGNDLWLLPLTGERKARPLLAAPTNELFGQVSPDGRWFLYQSDESGQNEIYVTSFPALQGKRQVSEDGARLPMWSATGQEIFYLTQDHSTLFAATVAIQDGTLHVSRRDRLFSAPMVAGRGYPYDVSKDGSRFLVVVSTGATTTPLTLVVDWPSALKR